MFLKQGYTVPWRSPVVSSISSLQHLEMGKNMSNLKSSNTVWHQATVSRRDREQRNGHQGTILWFTGLSGAGKSTLAHAVEARLHVLGCQTFVLDGDNVRHGLCADLGFSEKDRSENIRRVGEVCKLLMEAGVIVMAGFISPFQKDRDRARDLVTQGDFYEIFCKATLEVCEIRDVKGLYKRARAGEIDDFTGISAPYEEPVNPELVIDTATLSLEESVDRVMSLLLSSGVIEFGLVGNQASISVVL